MTAKFPTEARSFTPKVDLVDTVYADHVNALQEEVRALEVSLGLTTLTSTYSGAFALTYTWSNLSDRLANIEAGLMNGVAGSVFIKTGDTVQAAAGTIALTFKSANGNTADLLLTKDSSNANGFRVDSQGKPYVGTSAVVYEGGPAYITLQNQITSSVSAATLSINPFILVGV